MPQDNSIPLQPFAGESPVNNYLQSYYQAKKQKQEDRQALQQDRLGQQTLQLNDLKLAETKHNNLVNILGRSTDEASFQNGLRQATLPVEQGGLGLAPEQVAGLSFAKDYKRLQEEAGVIKERLGNSLLQAQIDASRASTQHSLAATQALREKPQGGSALAQNAAERAQLAQALGIDPRSDAGKRYILTGQMPNGLTPADRNAVQEADQKVLATKQGLGMLQQARKLSDQSNQGFGANTLAQVPALFGDKSSLNTIDFDNLLQSQVLPQLKTIFGGAPTEGERAILLELQGSSSMTRENRARILDRAIQMANERLKFYNDQAQGIRGGTYYNPGQGPLAGGQSAPAAAAPVAAPAAPKAPPPPPGFKVIQ